MIKVRDVSKTIKGQKILNHINLELEYGKVYGFVGRNGSGKTMLLKAICGFITPDEGSITINGQKLGKELDFPPNIGVIIEKMNLKDDIERTKQNIKKEDKNI